MKNIIKLSIIAIYLSLSLSCAQKPIASPVEVNDYLNAMCHRVADYGWESAVDGVSNYEMHKKLSTMLKSLNDER